jgi:hypothetical protein
VHRHIPIHGLVLPGLHQIGLVPDAGAAAASDATPLLAPDIEMGIVLVLGKRLEMLE